MLELCLIDFFLFIRDDREIPTNINKTMIIIFIIVMIIAYQLFLRSIFK